MKKEKNMSLANPAYRIPRQSVVGMEGMFVKMFDPPKDSPLTPAFMLPTNPVPEVMAAAGLADVPAIPHTVIVDLMHNLRARTWDNLKDLNFFVFRYGEIPAADGGNYPGVTLRMPRGVIFHATTKGHGPPPHTIHWHGIEPTPQNDGVGHCSMEIGDYTYQWQPNFIGTYFYHCHRNTMQHFEFGLFGLLLIEPPDAYFATLQDPAIPIGHCRDGKRRIAAYLAQFPQFPDWDSSPLDSPDPLGQYPVDPHAHTVAYDVEAIWVFDDRDSVWSDLAEDSRATFPKHGNIPGVDDEFQNNPGRNGFFAFNDFNADYWFVTGVPVPAHRGEVGTIPPDIEIPPELNSGVAGSQVSVKGRVGQTILLRCLNAAYNCTETTFPMDVVIIAWDGRALGVPPYGKYNHPYLIKANTPIHQSVARRCDILIRPTVSMNSFATVKFLDTRGQVRGDVKGEVQGKPAPALVTVKIPMNILGIVAVTNATLSTPNSPLGPLWTVQGTGIPGATVSIFAGPTAAGKFLGTAKVSTAKTWIFSKRVPGVNLTTLKSISVTTSDGAEALNVPLTTVTYATVNTTGSAASTIGALWFIYGRDVPGATVTVYLGPNLSGTPVDTVLVDQSGMWRLYKRILVALPITATRISVLSSTGGSLVNRSLTVYK